ncbi:M48 family metalloprotease [Thermocrinis sp.]|uniref:M48 family metalloprotease n=1 Tax=Thermocrinis sp. TaxID=2024383 RepID=UPI002FDE251D
MKARFLILIFTVFLISCAPSTSSSFTLLPERKEIEIGQSYIPVAIEEFDGLYSHREVQDYLSQLGNRLAKHTQRKLPYKFYLVNSEQVNAFALPGGPVFITVGLLFQLENESQLASVLGHELGHINARHHARFLEKMVALNILLNIGSVLISDKPYGQVLIQFGHIGAQLLSLKFSRDQEREADRFGIDYTIKAGYDPNGLIEVFHIFKRLEKDRPPEWLSTHPLPETRIREGAKYISSLSLSGSLIKDSQDFQRVKAIVQSTKPSLDEFYKGKKLYKEGRKDLAYRHFFRSVELWDKNYMPMVYLSIMLLDYGRVKEAFEYASRSYSIAPNVFSTNYVMGLVQFTKGDHRDSIKYLEEARKLIPDYPDVYYYLGRNWEALGDRRKAFENYKTAVELSDGKRPWESDARERLKRL